MAHHANAEYTKRAATSNFTMLQAFEWYSDAGGKHWRRLKDKVPELSDLGITALWLPPPTKAANPKSVGYDTYDLWDLGEFDQKGSRATFWGTKEELEALIKTANDAGIVSYVDAVLNHKFGADRTEEFKASEVDWDDRTKDVSGLYNVRGWTGFDFPGRNGKYSQLRWNFNHFTGIDYDDKNKKTKIYRIHGDGKEWAKGVDTENANYDFLMGADIDHAHPDVREDMLRWGDWIIKLGVAGFRFDAIKHIDEGFISDFVKHVRKTSPKCFAVGEYWKDSLEDLEGYLERFDTQFSLFDAPLHYKFKNAGDAGKDFDLRQIFDDTVVQKRPVDAVTLVENHDTQPGQSLESPIPAWFKPLAYTLILLRPDGYPCVFLGDLEGCNGPSEGAPQAMNQLGDMIRARKLFAYGELRDYFDHPNCVGWVRAGDDEHDGCAVVISNGDNGSKRMEIGKYAAGEKWTDILGWSKEEITVNDDGWATFSCPAQSVSIWVKEGARGLDEFKAHCD